MSEPILDYNPKTNQPHKTATGVDLAPVVFHPSRLLWRIQIVTYSIIMLAAVVAIFPFLLRAFYWSLLLLAFLLLIGIVLKTSARTHNLSSGTLSVIKQVWRLQISEQEFIVQPFDEILLWEFLIILPVRETLGGHKHRLLLMPDSLSSEDWRRLRVLLRMGLSKNS